MEIEALRYVATKKESCRDHSDDGLLLVPKILGCVVVHSASLAMVRA